MLFLAASIFGLLSTTSNAAHLPRDSSTSRATNSQTDVRSSITWRAVDWSSLIVEERAGVKYKSNRGVVQSLEKILVENGVNMVRQRVWVTNGDYGLIYNLQLARRARKAGLAFGLNLHYSETWTNPGLQDTPPGWPTDITRLSDYVYNYTLSICNDFAAESLLPETITLGNEINSGMLWPTGRYDQPYNLALLLKTASDAVRASNLDPKPQIQIHTTHAADWEQQEWFYNMILTAGPLTLSDFDVMGVSHYPFWGTYANAANLTTSLTNLVNNYGKPAMVLETNWPTSCPNPDYAFPIDTAGIPLSVDGQAIWIQRLASTIEAIPGGLGLSYWEPAWIHNAGLGSSCESNVMFDNRGRACSSLSVFRRI